MLNIYDIEDLINENLDESLMRNDEDVIYLIEAEEDEITTVQVDGEELVEHILAILDHFLPSNYVFSHCEVFIDTFQIPIRYLD